MSRVRLVMPAPVQVPKTVAPGAAGLSLSGFNPVASVAPTSGTILFQEAFDDANLSSRGWYDLSAPVISSVEAHSGAGSLETRYTLGATNTIGGALRVLFAPTETVYVSYWVKYSANWIGSGQTFQPHEFEIMTDVDGAFAPPANSHLSVEIEHNYQSGGIPILGATDSANIDQTQIGVDLTGITEVRSTQGCNGLLDNTHTPPADCFDSGGGFFQNGRRWLDSQVRFTDLIKNNWNQVEAYFQLNSILGGIGQADGVIRYWFNGVLTMEHLGVSFRTGQHPTMKFNQFLVAPFIGNGSPVDQTAWYDDLVIATNRPGTSSSPVVIPGLALLNIVANTPVVLVPGPAVASPGVAQLAITSFAPTVVVQGLFPLIQQALFSTANPWGITGNTAGFQDGGGGIPGSPHSAAVGEYSATLPLTGWSAPNFYNFEGLSFGVIELDFEFRMNQAPSGQIMGFRFQTGTGVGTSGIGVGGLYFDNSSGQNTISCVFEGMGNTQSLNFSFEARWDSPGIGPGVQIQGLADDAWHTARFFYDVASSKRRMKLEIDGNAISQPNGTSVYVLGVPENCGGTFGNQAATWQNGWIEFCTIDGGVQIGSGLWLDQGSPNSGATLKIRNVTWRNASSGFAAPDRGVYDFTLGTHPPNGPLEPTCGGTSPWETSSGGCSNRHRWNATEGAFESFWSPATTDDFEPIYIPFASGGSPISMLDFYTATKFKETAPMQGTATGSAQKVWRFSNPNRGGIHETPSGYWVWNYDTFSPNTSFFYLGLDPVSPPGWLASKGYNSIASGWAGDGLYHTLEIHYVLSNIEVYFELWFDGVPIVQPAGDVLDISGFPGPITPGTTIWRGGVLGVTPSQGVALESPSASPLPHLSFHEEASTLPMLNSGSLFLKKMAYSTTRIGPL